MNKAFIYIFSLFVTLQITAQQALSKSEISTLKSNIKKTSQKTKTIKSDFTQYKHLDFLSNDIITHGKLAFKAPNLVKWEYTKPYKYSVIFKNNSLLINDDGKKSNINIGSSELFKKMNELIIKSINGDMFDENEFTITYFKLKGVYIVKFTSKNEEFKKIINAFELRFNKKNYDVIQVKMIEPSGDYTKIIFKNRVLNTTIKNEMFSN